MEVKYISIDSIKEYENNPRNNEIAIDKVAESIKEFGFKVPIVIDKNNVIVMGHTRIKAAKLLGFEKVPCIIADDLTEEQIKAFRLVDNKTSEYSSWNNELLTQELETLEFDLSNFGLIKINESEIVNDYEKEWEEAGMPEYISQDNKPNFFVKVNFRNEKDMKEFAELVKQTITGKTKSIWYPKLEKFHAKDCSYEE